MSVENIGGMNKILNSYNQTDWAKSASIKGNDQQKLSFNSEIHSPSQQLMVNDLNKIDQKSFSEMLQSSLQEVNELQVEANVAMEKLASGQTKNIHETMLAVEKADIAFRTMNQVRMKVIEAYKEIMRMQM